MNFYGLLREIQISGIKVLSREELEENIKMRDKEKEIEEVERLAEEISRKHALGK